MSTKNKAAKAALGATLTATLASNAANNVDTSVGSKSTLPAVIPPLSELNVADLLKRKTALICPDELGAAIRQDKKSYGQWITWRDKAYAAGLRIAMLPRDVHDNPFKNELRDVVARNLLDKREYDLFKMPKAEAAKLNDLAKASRKRAQQDVGNIYNYLYNLLKKKEKGDAGSDGNGGARDMGEIMAEKLTGWADRIEKSKQATEKHKAFAKKLLALVKEAKTIALK